MLRSQEAAPCLKHFQSSNYNKSQFLLRLSAQLRRKETINAQPLSLLLGAHANLTENTIVSPAMWNMFSHA